MKKLITTLIFLSAPFSFAETKYAVKFDIYPYVGTLTSNAMHVEETLVNLSVERCGDLTNVIAIKDMTTHSDVTDTSHINPNGEIGSIAINQAVLSFAYPRIQGTATVICK